MIWSIFNLVPPFDEIKASLFQQLLRDRIHNKLVHILGAQIIKWIHHSLTEDVHVRLDISLTPRRRHDHQINEIQQEQRQQKLPEILVPQIVPLRVMRILIVIRNLIIWLFRAARALTRSFVSTATFRSLVIIAIDKHLKSDRLICAQITVAFHHQPIRIFASARFLRSEMQINFAQTTQIRNRALIDYDVVLQIDEHHQPFLPHSKWKLAFIHVHHRSVQARDLQSSSILQLIVDKVESLFVVVIVFGGASHHFLAIGAELNLPAKLRRFNAFYKHISGDIVFPRIAFSVQMHRHFDDILIEDLRLFIGACTPFHLHKRVHSDTRQCVVCHRGDFRWIARNRAWRNVVQIFDRRGSRFRRALRISVRFTVTIVIATFSSIIILILFGVLIVIFVFIVIIILVIIFIFSVIGLLHSAFLIGICRLFLFLVLVIFIRRCFLRFRF
mmetsp:Transcript_51460/g.82029  ORF Transcript_51460/g.82029 Transcript_51460/m.82029 type:complete len:444 (+) Transcript_51460:321-1652(+)